MTDTNTSPEHAAQHVRRTKAAVAAVIILALAAGAWVLWGDRILERCFGDSCSFIGEPVSPTNEELQASGALEVPAASALPLPPPPPAFSNSEPAPAEE